MLHWGLPDRISEETRWPASIRGLPDDIDTSTVFRVMLVTTVAAQRPHHSRSLLAPSRFP